MQWDVSQERLQGCRRGSLLTPECEAAGQPYTVGLAALRQVPGGSAAATTGAWTGISVTAIHTLGYLVVTGLIAWLVYEKLSLALLRKAWLNLDLIWTVTLMATGCFVLFI